MNIFYFSGMKLPSKSPQSVHVMKMAQAFCKAGHRVTLYAQSALNANAIDICKIYDVDTPFEIKLSSHSNLPILYNIRRFMGLRARPSGNRQKAPDLIYGHDVAALAFNAYYAKAVIFEIHNMPSTPSQKLAFAKLLSLNNLRGIVSVSDTLKSELLKAYPEIYSEQVFVAHDGADLVSHIQDDMHLETSLRGKNVFNIGYAGSLTPGKGVALISRIAKIRPEYDFHIFGGKGARVHELEENNKYKNLHFYGHRDHAEIPSYLKAFDVCVAPYQHRAIIKTGQNISRWISPMKIFEYMAVKKPIIASNLPVINDILENEFNAILLPPSDEYKWANAIDMLKENPEFREMISVNAYNTLKDNYTWDKRAQAILEFSKMLRHRTARVGKA